MARKHRQIKTSKQNRKKSKSLPYYYSIGSFLIMLILFALVYAFIQLRSQKMPVPDESIALKAQTEQIYHGPHLSTELTTTESGQVLGQDTSSAGKVAAQRKKTKNNSSKKKQEYGMATAGELIWLSQEKLDIYFNSLKSLGVKWVRWDVEWDVIQRDNSVDYNWEGTDRVVATAKKYGINSLGTISYTPKWARHPECKDSDKCEPANVEEFGRFVKEAASRYRDSITYWEIWNEPNYKSFWKPKPDVEKYADILREAYIEIKKENPQAVVLSGGLAVADDEDNGNISPYTFIQKLYNLGANQYFDALALHPYTYPASPNYQAQWNGWQQIWPIRQLMDDNGDGAKKIWITEFGAPTDGPGRSFAANKFRKFKFGTDYMKKSAQSNLMKEATSFCREYVDWIGPFFWYSLRDSGEDQNNPENFFGLLDYKGKKKPAYNVLKKEIKSKK